MMIGLFIYISSIKIWMWWSAYYLVQLSGYGIAVKRFTWKRPLLPHPLRIPTDFS